MHNNRNEWEGRVGKRSMDLLDDLFKLLPGNGKLFKLRYTSQYVALTESSGRPSWDPRQRPRYNWFAMFYPEQGGCVTLSVYTKDKAPRSDWKARLESSGLGPVTEKNGRKLTEIKLEFKVTPGNLEGNRELLAALLSAAYALSLT